jgi:methylphosphotriester-DNA--protein-cysteine methyltransferase
MDIQNVKWEHYPYVAAQSAARSFIERLTLKGKRPKTIDAYARAIEDLLVYFSGVNAERVLEADEADLDRYIASLKQRRPKKRPHQFVLRQRTERAKYLLREADLPLAHVALACGFANQGHLTRVFKRHMGLTPALYRKDS